ncbi:hypothetical protein [Methylocystis sp.]|uniref:hypothetical protein n=1 Tax=Methylocystis sp. TaxID=1911079 RepID=UPI0025F62279|nr:hypothetical protein [Methylocystis sp.]
MAHTAKSPPAATGGARNSDQSGKAIASEIVSPKQDLQALLPSRATLSRRWPGLRVNRLTWRWVDDASRARGEDIQSLLAFLSEGGSTQ